MILTRGTTTAARAFALLVNYLANQTPGLRLTSYYRAGDPGQHGVGTAADFGMRTYAEQRAARELAARWRAWGFVALEETGADPGSTAPHVHLQLFPADRTRIEI